MRALIACERSGIIRRAFRARGVEAYSCDLEPAEDDGEHIMCDHDLHLLDIIKKGWDLMIAHPECRDLAVSGAHLFKQKQADGRQQKAIAFFMALANAPVRAICIENPVCIMSTVWRKPDQIIQPFQFGHPESKKTCLWLKGLPRLQPTNVLPLPECGYWSNQTPSRQNKLGPSPTRAIERARTYQGIADAMATQWTADFALVALR